MPEDNEPIKFEPVSFSHIDWNVVKENIDRQLGDAASTSKRISQAITNLNLTGSYLGGTVTAVNRSVDQLERSISTIEDLDQGKDPEKELDQLKNSITSELDNVKSSIASLEELRKPIKDVEDFLKDQLGFITTAIEARGRLNTIENNLNLFQKRLGHVEEHINNSKARTITVVAAVVSILALLTNIAIAIFSRKP